MLMKIIVLFPDINLLVLGLLFLSNESCSVVQNLIVTMVKY